MAFTPLNNKWVNLETVLSEICIGINERRDAIDVTRIDFVIDRVGTTSQFPDPGDFDLRFYGQEFADIQQVITDEVKKVTYVSKTIGTVVYVSTIPDFTGTLPIDASPQNTITNTLDPDQWAWYISELNKKIKVRILPANGARNLTSGQASGALPVTYDDLWDDAIADLSTSTSLITHVAWEFKNISVEISSASDVIIKTSEYNGVWSNARVEATEHTDAMNTNTTENFSMDYDFAGASFTSFASPSSPSPGNQNLRLVFPTLTEGVDHTITFDITNLTGNRPFSNSSIPNETIDARVDVIYAKTLFHSDISGELTDQA